VTPRDALSKIEERLRAGATDAQLERLVDDAAARTAAKSKGKGKEPRVAKGASSGTVKQAGTPTKAKTTKKKS
jgi:hypothetical protein